MRISGESTIAAPVEKVWAALLDPQVLATTIPGCEQLEETAAGAYAMTVSAGVAAVRGTYRGSCTLADLRPPEGLRMTLTGAGAPGTIEATVQVGLAGQDGATVLTYDADAVVGGMIGGVGQRMLTSVARRMAAEFFGNVERALAEGLPTEAVEAPVVTPAQTVPAPATGADARSFLAGVALGGGLVLAGVVVGGLLGRRR